MHSPGINERSTILSFAECWEVLHDSEYIPSMRQKVHSPSLGESGKTVGAQLKIRELLDGCNYIYGRYQYHAHYHCKIQKVAQAFELNLPFFQALAGHPFDATPATTGP